MISYHLIIPVPIIVIVSNIFKIFPYMLDISQILLSIGTCPDLYFHSCEESVLGWVAVYVTRIPVHRAWRQGFSSGTLVRETPRFIVQNRRKVKALSY